MCFVRELNEMFAVNWVGLSAARFFSLLITSPARMMRENWEETRHLCHKTEATVISHLVA